MFCKRSNIFPVIIGIYIKEFMDRIIMFLKKVVYFIYFKLLISSYQVRSFPINQFIIKINFLPHWFPDMSLTSDIFSSFVVQSNFFFYLISFLFTLFPLCVFFSSSSSFSFQPQWTWSRCCQWSSLPETKMPSRLSAPSAPTSSPWCQPCITTQVPNYTHTHTCPVSLH